MAPYDEIADWYEDECLAKQRAHAAGNDFADEIGLDRSLHDLLGTGTGTCLEIGCGTGVYADRVRKLGWTPIGIDISSGMLRRALARLPVVQADVAQLPFASGPSPTADPVIVGGQVGVLGSSGGLAGFDERDP